MKNRTMQNTGNEKKFIGGGMDDFGKTFLYQNKIYRTISEDKKSFCIELLKCGLIEELCQKNLMVKTNISDAIFEESSLVLEHEKLTMSDPSEWSFSMLKDAAIVTLEVNKICNKYGYELKDSHPWNILFKENKPVFIDLGSIIKKTNKKKHSWIATKEFVVGFIYPLILIHEGEFYLAKKILDDGDCFYMNTIPSSKIEESKAVLSTVRKYLLRNHPLFFILSLPFPRKTVKNVALLSIRCGSIFKKLKINKKKTLWSNYQADFYKNNFDQNSQDFARFNEITAAINDRISDCDSLLDLAGNSGAMSFFATKQCKKSLKIINTDYDELAIDASYLAFQENKIPIESYLLNFMLPYSKKSHENFKSDIVLALAVTHHLILTQRFDINFIFEKVKSYSKKYVFIEFMPLGLYYGDDNNIPPFPTWYNKEWFKKNFENHFEIEVIKQLEKNRILFVGKIN
jgi:hypothetical protein